MATRAEKFRAESQRHASAKSKKQLAEHETKKSRKKRSEHAHTNEHAKKKATYALEARSKKGVASRKSTRGGANHARSDTKAIGKMERAGSASDARYRRGK